MQLLVLTRARVAQAVALVSTVVAVLGGFGIVHWSPAQAVMAATEASTALIVILAIEQTLNPKKTEEPVAIAGSISAFASSTFALLVGFQLVHWSAQQVGLVLGLVAAVVTLLSTWVARSQVTPVQQHVPNPPKPPAVPPA